MYWYLRCMTSAQLHCGGNWVGSFQRGPQSNRFQVCLCWLLGVPEQEGLFKRSAEQTSRIAILCWSWGVISLLFSPFFPMNNSISHFTFKLEDNSVYILGLQPCSKFFRSIYSFLYFSQNSCKMRVCYCY